MNLKLLLVAMLAVSPMAANAIITPARAPVVSRPVSIVRPISPVVKPAAPVKMSLTKISPPVIGNSPFFSWYPLTGKKKKECDE